jgi:hypothetical protein
VSGNGATIWKGTAFDCSSINNEFTIFHSTNDISEMPKYCSNGAIIGRAVGTKNDSYTSQITIQVSDEFNGKTVDCVHDDGTNFTEIGSAILNITTGTAATVYIFNIYFY